MRQANSYWDRETLEIRSSVFPESEVSQRAIDFLSSLLRVRDLELLTRDVVRSTFRSDAIAAIKAKYSNVATFNENAPVKKEFAEFPADFVLYPKAVGAAIKGALYFVDSNEKLNEALLLQMEALEVYRNITLDFKVIALLEEPEMKAISSRKFQRAQNRSVIMPIFRGDEDASVHKDWKNTEACRRLNADLYQTRRELRPKFFWTFLRSICSSPAPPIA